MNQGYRIDCEKLLKLRKQLIKAEPLVQQCMHMADVPLMTQYQVKDALDRVAKDLELINTLLDSSPSNRFKF